MSAITPLGEANNRMRSAILAGAMAKPDFKHKLCTTASVEEHFPGVFFKGLLKRVLEFREEAFEDSFDPMGDRAMIVVESLTKDLRMQKVWAIIDCYDNSMEAGSEDPANDEVTVRVMTIMLPEDY